MSKEMEQFTSHASSVDSQGSQCGNKSLEERRKMEMNEQVYKLAALKICQTDK